MFEEIVEQVRKKTPLVHCMTNYVTVNDCANILLACGGSPIMADDEDEIEEITSICGGLVLNIGTLNKRTIASMEKAGTKANELRHPIVLDPVGAGASILRTNTANQLIQKLHFAVIRGNSSEIRTIARGCGTTRGVDADKKDATTRENLKTVCAFAKSLSEQTKAVIAITGAIDVVADQKEAYAIFNGHPMMGKITGTGCMLTAVIAAYCTANPENPLQAAAAAAGAMGLCGEKAYEKILRQGGGTASLRMALLDEMSRLNGQALDGGIRFEVY